jgi:hypothetical protein
MTSAEDEAVSILGDRCIPQAKNPNIDTGRALKPPKRPIFTVVRLMIIAEAKRMMPQSRASHQRGINSDSSSSMAKGLI